MDSRLRGNERSLPLLAAPEPDLPALHPPRREVFQPPFDNAGGRPVRQPRAFLDHGGFADALFRPAPALPRRLTNGIDEFCFIGHDAPPTTLLAPGSRPCAQMIKEP